MVYAYNRHAQRVRDEPAVLGIQPRGIGRTRIDPTVRIERHPTWRGNAPARARGIHAVDWIEAAAPDLDVRSAIRVRVALDIGRREGARVGGCVRVERKGVLGAGHGEGVRDLGIKDVAGPGFASGVVTAAGGATGRARAGAYTGAAVRARVRPAVTAAAAKSGSEGHRRDEEGGA